MVLILLKHSKLVLYEIVIEAVGVDQIIREVKASDESELLSIRNQPENYKWFFHQSTISTEEHATWFRLRLSESSQPTLVVEQEGSVVGVGYLSKSKSNTTTVSISIQPKWVGNGLGTKLLKELITRAKSLGLDSIFAEIKSTNDKSVQFFTKNGFTKVSVEIRSFGNSEIEVVTLSITL